MNHWRMRKGNGGSDMFERCLIHGVAAIHYNPVESIDLGQHTEEDLPDEWPELESSQSGSLKKFAWRIRGGDTIYVAESYPSRIVGVGRVRGTQAVAGYHYDPHTPIIDEDQLPGGISCLSSGSKISRRSVIPILTARKPRSWIYRLLNFGRFGRFWRATESPTLAVGLRPRHHLRRTRQMNKFNAASLKTGLIRATPVRRSKLFNVAM